MLFGRGSTGGVINQVSKTAQPVDSNEITVTGGSNSYKRATVDLNKAITDNVAFRLNAMDTKTTSERSGATSKRYGIAPTLTIGAGTQDEVNLSYYLNENNVPDYGVPYVKGADGISRPLNVSTNRFYGLSNADYERNQTGIATASYTHLFSNDSSIKTTVRDAHYSRDLRATAPRFADRNILESAVTDSTVINRQRQARGAKERKPQCKPILIPSLKRVDSNMNSSRGQSLSASVQTAGQTHQCQCGQSNHDGRQHKLVTRFELSILQWVQPHQSQLIQNTKLWFVCARYG